MAKGLKLKVKKFWGLIPTFVEVTGEKLVGMAFLPSLPPFCLFSSFGLAAKILNLKIRNKHKNRIKPFNQKS